MLARLVRGGLEAVDPLRDARPDGVIIHANRLDALEGGVRLPRQTTPQDGRQLSQPLPPPRFGTLLLEPAVEVPYPVGVENLVEATDASLDLLPEPRLALHGRNQPEFPFWHLQSDGLWEIPGGDSLPKKKGGSSVPARALRKLNVRGGLPAGVDRLLRGDRELVETAAVTLLNGHFPHSFHTQIRDAVGLPETMAMEVPASYGSASARKRDPKFRRAVLTAYERRCAICEFDVRLDDELLGLDAAHIKWHAAGGPDRVPNGLALCKLHHLALDRGAIGLDPAASLGFTLLVSQELSGTSEDFRRLVDARGRPLRQPQSNSQLPNRSFVALHRREVFRGEPRTS